ncbi:MAG TPA: carboxypeptidase-like regulatory domain-containing protein [Acidobacteriaceae bacterium]|nr:carboxypeptidase-like regulatory domain-containing protein [Acidobacteriaceae bacterium]
MQRRFLHTATAILVLALSLCAASAQVVGGTIRGQVKDPNGKALAGATVTVRNVGTGLTRKAATGPDGRFSTPSLPVGRYSVTVTASGYGAMVREGVAVNVGQSVDLAFAAGSEPVVTGAAAASVNTTTHPAAGVVGEGEVKDLNFDGQGYEQLITVNPATANYTSERSGGSGTASAGVSNQYTVVGRRPQDNLFLLNGIEYTGMASSTVEPGGLSGQLLGADSIDAMNVVTDTYGANYGKRDGGQISVVTSSGTNQWHGDAFEYFRNNNLDTRNYFDQGGAPQYQRNQFGGSLGGPLKPSKLLFFTSFEGFQLNTQETTVSIVPDSQARQGYVPNSSGSEENVGVNAAVAPLLALYPAQNGPELLSDGVITGLAESFNNPPQHTRENFGTARLDDNLGDKDLLFGVYTADDSDFLGTTQNPISQVNQSLREQVASLQEQHVFSSSTLNTARIGYSRATFSNYAFNNAGAPGWVAGQPVGSIVISGSTASNGISQVTQAGNNVGADTWAARNLFTFDDHVYWTRGKHQFEAGVWGQAIESNDFLAQNKYGQASFATLTTFLQGPIQSFTVVPQPSEMAWRSFEKALFVEDIWKATPRLELRAGLRLESTDGWNGVNNRAANYAVVDGVMSSEPFTGKSPLLANNAEILYNPRFGFAWDLFGNGRTAVRGGAGLYHSLLDALDYRLDQTAPFNTAYSIKGATVASLDIVPGGTLPSSTLVTPSTVQTNLFTPAVVEWRLRVEQQLAPHTTLMVGYAGSHGYHQILSEDQNEPVPSYTSTGEPYYPSGVKDANPDLSKSTSWASEGVGMYNGLETDLRGNVGGGVVLRATYTYAKNLDDGSTWTSAQSLNTPGYVEFPLNPKMDWGPAVGDVRNAATVSANWALPLGPNHALLSNASGFGRTAAAGWSVSGIVTAHSGFPFTPQLGYNPTGNGDSRNPIRPNWNPAFTGPLYPKTVTEWFNPNAFVQPATGYFGNVSRDSLVGPGLTDFDFSAAKDTPLENFHLQLRAGFYNILNRANFRTPNEITYASATSIASPTGGLITQTATSSRQIQFSAKILF